jgi:phosphoribosyl 1,2-cyclic phosphodiesterase
LACIDIEGFVLKIKFWGTRGSLPQALNNSDIHLVLNEVLQEAENQGINSIPALRNALDRGELGHPLSFGGNTTCTEVAVGDQSFFVDMGSGLREAGTEHMAVGRKEFHIFLTHMHWDHVMGLPFFVPVHAPGHVIKIYHVHRNAPEHVKINFNGINFPLTWDQLVGRIEFVQMKLYEPVTIGATSVTAFVLDHPGGSFGFRFEAEGKSCAIGVDGEFKRISRPELGRDLEFYQNLDILVFDAQYEIAELASRFDWGHCSPNIGVDLALREQIKSLVFTHHDPWATPAKLRRMAKSAISHLQAQLPAFKADWEKIGQPQGPRLVTAWDGLVIDLDNR